MSRVTVQMTRTGLSCKSQVYWEWVSVPQATSRTPAATSWRESQSRPSWSPMPLRASQPWMCQLRPQHSLCKLRSSVISSTDTAPGTSCRDTRQRVLVKSSQQRSRESPIKQAIKALFMHVVIEKTSCFLSFFFKMFLNAQIHTIKYSRGRDIFVKIIKNTGIGWRLFFKTLIRVKAYKV